MYIYMYEDTITLITDLLEASRCAVRDRSTCLLPGLRIFNYQGDQGYQGYQDDHKNEYHVGTFRVIQIRISEYSIYIHNYMI